MPRLELLEDEIGRKLQEAQQTGELALKRLAALKQAITLRLESLRRG